MKKQAVKKAPKVKLSKSEQKDREKALDKKLSAEALPKYLTEGLVVLDKDVLCEGVNLYTPDGKVELVKNARVQLLQGRRYGLIGKNGIGKTTLLNQISGYKLEGFPQYLRVMHVRQEANIASDMPVIDYVVKSDELKAYLENEEKRVLDAIEEGETEDVDGTDLNVKLDKIYERLEDINARTAEGRARQILLGLQFSDSMIAGPTKALSGGWRVRVSLACALFVQPDILLLDEPTNHLDFPAVDWLISYLKVYTKTCIVVSHDRGFLNNVITDVMDMHDQKLDYYRGDYDCYVKTREENLKLAQRNYDKQEKERSALKQFIEEAKRSKNRQVADMAASRQARLDKMEVVEAPVFEKPWSFTFPDPGSLDHAIVSLIKVTFGWDEKQPDKPLLRNVDGFVDMKSRIGVLGANGAGKTTLINLILGKLKPWSGQLRLNEQARTVLFTQHHMDQLDMHLTPLEYIQKLFPLEKEGRIRGFLGHFGFDQNLITHKIGTLSGGQKSRVAFAILSWNNPHCIIMDEPTNHLDLQTVEALATSLKTFAGGVILISHDIYFLSEVAEVFWAVNTAGDVKEFYDLDQAKAFSYKPILYKPLEAMQEETKEVKAAFAAKKAAEAAAREAEYARKLAALDNEIANIKVESVAMDDEETKGEATDDADKKKGGKKGDKQEAGKKGDKGKDKAGKDEPKKAKDEPKKVEKSEPKKKSLEEQFMAFHLTAPAKKVAPKPVAARPGVNMAIAGFGALELSEEEEEYEAEPEEVPKEKKKKQKDDGEKKKKKKDKGDDEDGEEGEKEKKKKKKDKGEDEGDDKEGGKEKKKKKKKDKGDDEEDGEEGEKEKKKKKKKDKGEDEEEGEEEKEKKKKKKKDKGEDEEEGEEEKEKKKKKKDKGDEGDSEGEKEKKKKKKDKGDDKEEGEGEKEKKKKKKKDKGDDEEDGEEGEKEKKKKKKDKGDDEEEGEGEKEKKKKKKDKGDDEEDGEGEKEKKKKKKDKVKEGGDEGEETEKKKKKKDKDHDVEEEGDENAGEKKKKKEKGKDGDKKKKKDKGSEGEEEDAGVEEEAEGKKDKKKKTKEGNEAEDEEQGGKGKKKDKKKHKDKEDESEQHEEVEEDEGKTGKGKKAEGKNKKKKDDEEEPEVAGPEANNEEDADALERKERLARLDKKAQSKKERANAAEGEAQKAEGDEWGKKKNNEKGKQKKKQEEEEEELPKKKAQDGEEEHPKKGKKGKNSKGDDDEEEQKSKKDKKGDQEEEEDDRRTKKSKKGGKKGGDDDDEDLPRKKKGGKKVEEDDEEDEESGKKKKGGKKVDEDEEGVGRKQKKGKKGANDEDEEAGDKKKGKTGRQKKGPGSDDEEDKADHKAEPEPNPEDQRLMNMVKGIKGLSMQDPAKSKKGKGKVQDEDDSAPSGKKGKEKNDDSDGESSSKKAELGSAKGKKSRH